MKSGKKAEYTAELGSLISVVCAYRRVDCNSVIGVDNGVMATPGRVDCWSAGKVTQ